MAPSNRTRCRESGNSGVPMRYKNLPNSNGPGRVALTP